MKRKRRIQRLKWFRRRNEGSLDAASVTSTTLFTPILAGAGADYAYLDEQPTIMRILAKIHYHPVGILAADGVGVIHASLQVDNEDISHGSSYMSASTYYADLNRPGVMWLDKTTFQLVETGTMANGLHYLSGDSVPSLHADVRAKRVLRAGDELRLVQRNENGGFATAWYADVSILLGMT